jgi:uncharacterized protein YqeY
MLIEKIKTDQLTARKAKNALAASLLTTLIGEAEAIGKNAGNRAVADDEVVALVKKFMKGIDESIIALSKNLGGEKSSTDSEFVRFDNLRTERAILEGYLPQQLDAMRLEMTITGIMMTVGKNTGAIMKELKASFNGQYDGKQASEIVKRLVAG